MNKFKITNKLNVRDLTISYVNQCTHIIDYMEAYKMHFIQVKLVSSLDFKLYYFVIFLVPITFSIRMTLWNNSLELRSKCY